MKHFLFLSILLSICGRLFGQDVIVKNDKSEIKAKVLEVDETDIKYKQFDFQNGPTYSIGKQEVFMIIYENGRREMYGGGPTDQSEKTPQHLSAQSQPSSGSFLKPSTPNLLVNYHPVRFVVYYQGVAGGYSLGPELSFQGRLAKSLNFFDWGLALGYNYTTVSTGDMDEAIHGNGAYIGTETNSVNAYLYAVAYLPVNLVSGKLVKKDRGLFPFIRLGFFTSTMVGGYTDTYFPDPTETYTHQYTDLNVSSSFEFGYDLGIDYKFSNGFGISLITAKFKQFGFGFNFQFGNKKAKRQ